MIRLTTLDGRAIVLNAELIEHIECIPETSLTLVSGKKILVKERSGEVVERVLRYRRSILSTRGRRKADPF